MRKYNLTDTIKLYHISVNRLGDEVFYPRVPNERAQFEDDTIPRICVSTSVRGCIKGLGIDGTHHHVFLYTPVEYKGKKIKGHIFKPTVDEVPDVVETREKWIKRCSRVKKNQLLILGSDQGNCTMDNIYSFLRLPYNDKLFLGRHKEISSSYYIYCRHDHSNRRSHYNKPYSEKTKRGL